MAKQHPASQQAQVLVVEDEENNRLIAVKLLQLAGVPSDNIYAVESDPTPFLQTFTGQINLILLDLQLPGKDGYKVLQELRQKPQLEDVPIIAMTANVMKTDIEKMRQAQFDGLIGKPINARRFGEWIERILAGETIWTSG
jgi:two-component system cell cycle response regulator DivK